MFMILPGCLFSILGYKLVNLKGPTFLLNLICIFVGLLILLFGLFMIVGGIICQNC